MKSLIIASLILLISGVSMAADVTKECPTVNNVEILGGVGAISCYLKMSCLTHDDQNQDYGKALYFVEAYLPQNSSVRAGVNSFEDTDYQEDELVVSKYLSNAMSQISNGEVSQVVFNGGAKACDQLRKNNVSAAKIELKNLLGEILK